MTRTLRINRLVAIERGLKLMKKEYIVEQVAKTRWFYKFMEPNSKGETLTIELSKCRNTGGTNSLPYLWKKKGYTNRILTTYWSISTYVRDTEGACYGRYNPQTKVEVNPETGNPHPVINFDWMFEATEENKQKLIDEVYRLFSSATGKTATELKLEKVKEFAKERGVELYNEIPEGWKDTGGMTAPIGSTWVSNMKPFKSGERKSALLII